MPKDIEAIEDALNDKQIRFAQEYVVDLNGTQAYKRAGYDVESDDVAKVNASRLLTNANVKALVERCKKDREKRTQITADRVLAQVHDLAFSDIRKLYGEDGELLPISKLPDELAAAIQSVKVSDRKVPGSGSGEDAEFEAITEYKLVDKKSTIEMLMKHLGELNERVDVNVTGDLPALMAEAQARVIERSEQNKPK